MRGLGRVWVFLNLRLGQYGLYNDTVAKTTVISSGLPPSASMPAARALTQKGDKYWIERLIIKLIRLQKNCNNRHYCRWRDPLQVWPTFWWCGGGRKDVCYRKRFVSLSFRTQFPDNSIVRRERKQAESVNDAIGQVFCLRQLQNI